MCCVGDEVFSEMVNMTDLRKISDWVAGCQRRITEFLSTQEVTLYKYQKFDRNAFLSTVSGKIKVTNPKDFNDLYDLDLLSGEYFPMTDRKNSDLLRDVMRVSCFTTTPDSILMWAHYADNNRGICYCYDLNIKQYNEANPFGSIVSVIYEDHPVNLKEVLKHSDDDNIIRLRTMALAFRSISKCSEWSYEKELRLLIQLNEEKKNKIHNFGSSLELYDFLTPSDIILGAKFDEENVRFIKDNFAGNIYQIRPNDCEYSLDIRRL